MTRRVGASSNPFDDGPDSVPPAGGVKQSSSNPFDDPVDDESNNPFAAPDTSRRILGDHNAKSSRHTGSEPDLGEEEEDIDIDLLDEDDNAEGGITPAEASWQYLGDLPYRRIPIYSNVRWNTTTESANNTQQTEAANDFVYYGLSTIPKSLLQQKTMLLSSNPHEVRQLLQTTTKTLLTGCPYGGPIAVMTVPQQAAPALSVQQDSFAKTRLRIMTNAGKIISEQDFPPPTNVRSGNPGRMATKREYSPADVIGMGFTSRTTLIVVMKDSLCFTMSLDGKAVLQPFYIFPHQTQASAKSPGTSPAAAAGSAGVMLQQASIYEGGVAVLASNKHSAIVELFDEHDDVDYLQTAHVTAHRIPSGPDTNVSATGTSGHYALVTHLPTASYAAKNFLSYMTLQVLPRSRTTSRHPEVFVSTSDNSVIIVDTSTLDIVDVNCRSRIASPIVDMSFAPNGRFLACFTESSMLTVISTSFETKVLDFDTSEGSQSPPLDMQWCGEDSVVLHWKKLGVLMVGPYGDWLRFPYEGHETVHLIPEMDCCRVITDSSVELLQRVPPATAQLLRIGSIETSAMLLDASDSFHDAGAPASEDAARAISKTGMLTEAIEICTDTAAREFDIVTQKRLLRAASFGMHFSYKNTQDNSVMGGPVTGPLDHQRGLLPSRTTIKFVDSARKIRVLNALRNPDTGFILTSAQYDAISPAGVVARLIAMKRPALATSISKYLGLPKSVQLFARASKAAALVVETDYTKLGISDSEIAQAAIQIINEENEENVEKGNDGKNTKTGKDSRITSSSINRGAYATVAMAASKAGKTGVANLLLMLETSAADKIPALITTGSYADAIAVATTARDADFIFSTLMEYERTCMSSASDVSQAQATFLGTVVSKFTPEAFHTLRRYLGTTSDVASVTNLLLRAQKFTDAGAAMAIRALGESDMREKQGILAEASRVFGLGKDTTLYKSCTDDYLELLKDQEVVRTKYGSADVAPGGTSVTGTIASVIRFAATNVREQHRLLADADKLAKKFRVPEKRLWHIKVKAFADSDQWSNLRLLAESKAKSPIGYKPFARAAIRGKRNADEIQKYIDRIPNSEDKYDLLCEAAMWKKALSEAVKLRDPRRIINVKSLCNSNEIQLLADEMMGKIA